MTVPSSPGGWLLAGIALGLLGAVLLSISESSAGRFLGWGLVVCAVLAAQVALVAKGVELGLEASRRR